MKIIHLSRKARPQWLYSFIFLCILTGCTENNPSQERTSRKKEIHPFSKLDFSAIESGDIILKQGKGSLSRMIVKNLREEIPISHCGVLIRDKDSVYIIHSVARELTGVDGVQTIDFNSFMSDCVKGYVYVVRYRGNAPEREQLVQTTRNYLLRRAAFDYDINYLDSGKVNCSELIYWALPGSSRENLFKKVKVKDKYPLAFNSLLDTVNFQIIYRY